MEAASEHDADAGTAADAATQPESEATATPSTCAVDELETISEAASDMRATTTNEWSKSLSRGNEQSKQKLWESA
jgi:hypothetical protein